MKSYPDDYRLSSYPTCVVKTKPRLRCLNVAPRPVVDYPQIAEDLGGKRFEGLNTELLKCRGEEVAGEGVLPGRYGEVAERYTHI